MSELTELVYSPLMEEEQPLVGWSKQTISYVTKHTKIVHNYIRGIAKLRGKLLSEQDVDDIYSELLQYLYQCDDWNLSKAYERSGSKSIVTLPAYVHVCTKFVTIRSVTKYYEHENNTVRDVVKENDGKELSIFDKIADTRVGDIIDGLTYNLENLCKSYEGIRYKYGPDLFQIWYVRLKTIQAEKQDKYSEILSVLGVSKKDVVKLKNSDVMTSIAKAVSTHQLEESIKILANYVYSVNRLDRIIELA